MSAFANRQLPGVGERVHALRTRSKEVLDRHGPVGVVKLAAGRVQRAARLRETYIWYELQLGVPRPRRELPDGCELLVARDASELALFETIGSGEHFDLRERMAEGLPWMVVSEGRPAFGCWTFLRRTPMRAVPGNWLELPEGVACLEDSVTAPDFRGRGIAPGAWTGLADQLERDGYRAIVTKVMDTNAPSRKAVEKAGFREVASFELVRTGPRVNLVANGHAESNGAYLARTLDGTARWLVA